MKSTTIYFSIKGKIKANTYGTALFNHLTIAVKHFFSKVLPLRLLQLLQIRGTRNKEDPQAKGKIREWQRALIPLHLHARQLTIPKFYYGRDIVIKAPLPEYFEETLQLLKLHPKRKKMEQSPDLPEYYRLKQLGKSTRN